MVEKEFASGIEVTMNHNINRDALGKRKKAETLVSSIGAKSFCLFVITNF